MVALFNFSWVSATDSVILTKVSKLLEYLFPVL